MRRDGVVVASKVEGGLTWRILLIVYCTCPRDDVRATGKRG